MNAPFRQRDVAALHGTLHLFAFFHLNIMFSSIAEEQRAEVIRRCYWPLLDLAAEHGPIGIEATGYTLEVIDALDPEWIGRCRALIATGKVELIGSGYAQLIGPLVPARVSEENLRIGNRVYKNLLGVQPSLALVNEQAYSAGLVGLYLDAGYRALLMDWDNPGAQHPEWPRETRYLPQQAVGSDGRAIDLIWTNTVAFQKLQRFAHGDIALDDYAGYVRTQLAKTDRALCLYASDVEIFDFRPGRYKTEEKIADTGEWNMLARAFARLAQEKEFAFVAPSDVLSLTDTRDARQKLHLESAACPVPVKKQRKYALARWAVTGRDDIAINAACQRIHDGLVARNADAAAWKDLCYLWSSDFRTHITDARWTEFCTQLREAESKYASPPPCGEVEICTSQISGGGMDLPPHPDRYALRSHAVTTRPHKGEAIADRYVDIETPTLKARLDRRRGLAIESLHFAGHPAPVVGGLRHGHFDDIALQADWYTGDCVFEAPGEHKITDLEWCEAHAWKDDDGDVVAQGVIATPLGPIRKTLRFGSRAPRVDFDITFDWTEWGRGALRMGHFTLLPGAFEWAKLSLTTHNGGKEAETFSLNGHAVDHGAAVSFLVSSSHGIGMTEGWAELGDDNTRVRIDVDRATAPLLGLLTHRRAAGSVFCQLQLSALELDETRKPCAFVNGARRFRFGISAA
ncbi:MAG: glycoside hydrolase family 57 [Proteobacteria bacterium]|nr:glycoside hydrolase family 57 [Pseudomonadota bacterium]